MHATYDHTQHIHKDGRIHTVHVLYTFIYQIISGERARQNEQPCQVSEPEVF